jgi:hypothetical protein
MVADTAHKLAVGRMSGADARFIQQVGLLHDIDPYRKAGSAARVPATLEALEADFAGKKSLTGKKGRLDVKAFYTLRFSQVMYRTKYFAGAIWMESRQVE